MTPQKEQTAEDKKIIEKVFEMLDLKRRLISSLDDADLKEAIGLALKLKEQDVLRQVEEDLMVSLHSRK